MYNASKILREDLLDVLLEAVVTDEATSDFEGGRIVSIPIMIERIAYSKNAEELIPEEGSGAEAKVCYGAGKKNISETKRIYMHHPGITLPRNTMILARTDGLPVIKKSDNSLWVGEIYVLNEKKDITNAFQEEF